MSSRYNRGRKVQPHPPFCYSKKPGRLDVLPCDGGPAIGPNPQAILIVNDTRTMPNKKYLIVGRVNLFAAPATYIGLIVGPTGDRWNCNFTFEPVSQTFDFNADTTDAPWGPISIANIGYGKYTGGKQIDTTWVPMTPNTARPGVNFSGRIFL